MERSNPARVHDPDLALVVEKKIRTLIVVRRLLEAQKSKQDRLADAITRCLFRGRTRES